MQTGWKVARKSRGLTLVELLLTLMAIMILASVGWKATKVAVDRLTTSQTTMELAGLDRALQDFAARFGDYPPDFHDSTIVWRFLKGRFPQCPQQNYPDMCGQSPATALYFWLAGPDGTGYNTNPKNPFAKGGERIRPFYKFIPEQLKCVDGLMMYYPPRSPKEGAPYVYFRGSLKGYDMHPGWATAHPYRDSRTDKWINSETFQVLSPGVDGKYGNGCRFPSGIDYDDANMDDSANFTRGDTMRDAKPRNAADVDKLKQ